MEPDPRPNPAAADPAALLDGLDAWLAGLRDRGVADDQALAALDATLSQSRGEGLHAPSDPLLVVMLCGPTAVGKSSLINTVAGAEISSPGLGATTSAAVFYVHERDDPGRLFEYGETVGRLARGPHAVVRHDRDELLRKVLVDTPDIDSVVLQHRALTEALVHAADIVLFVTTPEKYKNMQAAQWVSDQRRRRAMAFVLNKWDRESIGLQYDRRDEVERDFRRVLADRGFESPLLFKVTSAAAADGGTNGAAGGTGKTPEDQLGQLRAWLETGLSRSASAAIQDRRRRAAWGRAAAAVAAAVPAPLDDKPWVAVATQALADSHPDAREIIQATVAAASAGYADHAVWPVTPGVFGTYGRLLGWCWSLTTKARAWGGRRGRLARFAGMPVPVAKEAEAAADGEDEPARPVVAIQAIQPREGQAFGDAAAEVLADTTRALLFSPDAHRLPIGPVKTAWSAAVTRLAADLNPLPARVEAELLADATRRSARRTAGWVALIVIELMLAAVVLTLLWRVGKGFFLAEYANAPMLASAATLTIALLLAGHVIANLFFPPLRARFQAELAKRTDAAVDDSWRKAQAALRDHVAAVARLAREGREVLRAIDGIVQSFAQPVEEDAEVQRLFGQESPTTQPPTSQRSPATAVALLPAATALVPPTAVLEPPTAAVVAAAGPASASNAASEATPAAEPAPAASQPVRRRPRFE